MKWPPFKSEVRITILYLLFGGLWIILSDRLLAWLITDLPTLNLLQTFKGWFYVLISAILIFFLLRSALNRERQTHAELDEATERFRLIFSNSLDAVLLTAPDGRIFNANPAACRMLGYTEEEICRLGRAGVADTSDPRLAEAIASRENTGQFSGVVNFVRAGGEVFPCEISSSMFTDRSGRPHSVMVIRDISQRKRAEQVLVESEALYRQLTESINEVLILYDTRANRVIYVNPAYERVMGHSSQAAYESSNLNAEGIHPDDRERVQRAFLESNLGNMVEVEYRLVRPDGAIRWLRAHAYPLFDESGDEYRTIVLAEDFTERKNTEDALKEKERLLAESQKIALLGTWEYDPTLDRIVFSDELYNILSIDPAAFAHTGEAFLELIDPDDRQLVQEWAESALEGGSSREADFRMRMGNGSPRYIHGRGESRCDATGRVVRLVGTAQDITERKRAEEKVQESESRYRDLFEHSPISLWVEDYSFIQKRLEELRARGVKDMQAYFTRHFDEVKELASKVRIVDVNRTTLEMYEAASKEEMITFLPRVFKDESFRQFLDQLLFIASGKRDFGFDVVNQTMKGRALNVSLRWSVVPGHEQDLSEVIVSLIDVTARKQAQERAQRQFNFLTALRNIDRTIASTFDMRLSLNALLAQSLSLLSVDAAAVLTYNPSLNKLEYVAGIGFKTSSIESASIRLGESYAGLAVQDRMTVHVPDIAVDGRAYFRQGFLRNEGFVSYWGVPLIAKGKVSGVLEVFQRSPVERDQDWEDFLNSLAGLAAIAIDNARMFDNVQRANMELAMAYDATIEGWSHALDLRDRETQGHTRRVTEKTLIMADLMNISETEKIHMRRGALLHDIGKLGVPDQVLFKADDLTEAEWEVMRRHPVFAYEMLSPIDYLRAAMDIPYCHHEKWDGSGYPRGLKGEEIPLPARIFAVVDIADALASDRPYRAAWPRQKVIDYIRSLSGNALDPQVVRTFLNANLI